MFDRGELQRAWRERDVSDLLSPMVVKEMRQGVRRNVFVGAMVILQALAVLALSVAMSEKDREIGTFLFWMLVVLPLVIAPAAAGAVSVGEERKRNTLDPVLLTPLSARRIVFGKWCAAYAQTLLLACTLVPYILLRYFLGGIDLFAELAGFAGLIVGAGVLAAINVSFANIGVTKTPAAPGPGGVGGGVAAVLFVIFVVLPGIPMLGAVVAMGRTNPWGILPALGMGILTLLMILEGGALHLAHVAEKQPAFLRVLALLTVPLARVSVGLFHSDAGALVWVWAGILGLMTSVLAVSEPRLAIRSLHERWVGRGPVLDALGRVLAAGWVSGVGFATLLAAEWCVALAVFPPGAPSADAGSLLWRIELVLAGVLMPVPLVRRLLPRVKSEVAAWFFFHLLALVPAILGGLLFILGLDSIRDAMPFLMAPSPWLVFAWGLGDPEPMIAIGVVVAAVCVAAAWHAAVTGWSETRRFVVERALAEPPSAAAAVPDVLAS